jgi:hypothetical protein
MPFSCTVKKYDKRMNVDKHGGKERKSIDIKFNRFIDWGDIKDYRCRFFFLIRWHTYTYRRLYSLIALNVHPSIHICIEKKWNKNCFSSFFYFCTLILDACDMWNNPIIFNWYFLLYYITMCSFKGAGHSTDSISGRIPANPAG